MVEDLLLDGIRQITAYAREHEDDFVEMVTKKKRSEADRSLRDGKRELEQAQDESASWMKSFSGSTKIMSRARSATSGS